MDEKMRVMTEKPLNAETPIERLRSWVTANKGEDSRSDTVVTGLKLKAIITQPLGGESLPVGTVVILGAAYAGESEVARVEVSVDGGATWEAATFLGPNEPYAWRQWQFVWEADNKGEITLMARATDAEGRRQPMHAEWNVLGYGNNGVSEHAVTVTIA